MPHIFIDELELRRMIHAKESGYDFMRDYEAEEDFIRDMEWLGEHHKLKSSVIVWGENPEFAGFSFLFSKPRAVNDNAR